MANGAAERPYLSIGEVLGLLLEEFPDVTISKIRFLESQGLIEPERTSSGYRKFYDADVERLRVILREQRENFLPLRVIRDRLENGAIDDSGGTSRPSPRGIRNVAVDEVSRPTSALAVQGPVDGDVAASGGNGAVPTAPTQTPTPTPTPAARHATPADDQGSSNGDDHSGAIEVDPAMVTTSRHPAAQLRQAPPPPAPVVSPPAVSSSLGGGAYSAGRYVRSEVCAMCGVSAAQLAELESFGLVSGRGSGADTSYSEQELAIVQAAAGFLARGIDVRHLRTWKQAAERETALFEQRVLPLLRQRNPQARHDAQGLLQELADLGGQLRSAMVAAALRQHLDG